MTNPTIPIEALEAPYEQGWHAAAQWAQRNDLHSDTGSAAYTKERDERLGRLAATEMARQAAVPPATPDVEAWIKRNTHAFVREDGAFRKYLDPNEVRTFLTTTIAAARAEESMDAKRYRFLRESHAVTVLFRETDPTRTMKPALFDELIDAKIIAAKMIAATPQQE